MTISFQYQWLSNGVSVPGATETTFFITEDLLGTRLTVRITATNAAGSTSVEVPAAQEIQPAIAPLVGAACRLLTASQDVYMISEDSDYIEPESAVSCLENGNGSALKISEMTAAASPAAFDRYVGILNGDPVAISAWQLGGHGVYYIDGPLGSDGGDGTFLSPFKTIARAVLSLRDSDTVLLKTGTSYSEGLTITKTGINFGPYGDPGDALPVKDGVAVAWP